MVNGSLLYVCELWGHLSGSTASETHIEGDGSWSWAHLDTPSLCEVAGNNSVSWPVNFPAGPRTVKGLLLEKGLLVLWVTRTVD